MTAENNQKMIFLSGKYVNLVGLTEDDALNSDWFSWFNDPDTTRFMQKGYFPNTAQQQLDFYRQHIVGNPSKLQLGIVASGENTLVGIISLNNIDHLNQKAEISMIIGNANFRQMRYTVEAMKLIIEHGFNILNLHKIYGGTLSKDWADLLCKTLTFTPEGKLRQDIYKSGTFYDVHMVAVLRDEYKTQPA